MSVRGIHPVVSEYGLLWEALKHHEERLSKMSSMSSADEDQQLKYDEKLQGLQGMLKAIKIAAKRDYDLDL
jgi:hypothetical protein